MSYSIRRFERIYSSCFPPALRLAVSMLHDEDEARDVVQEVFIKLWETQSEPDNPESYIIRAVRNTCLNHIEASDIRQKFKMGYSLDQTEALPYDEERNHEVEKAIKTLLTDREQQVVESVFNKGLSYKEASLRLNVSVALINKCVVSALKTLRNHFKKQKS